jgi:hypothetical protein
MLVNIVVIATVIFAIVVIVTHCIENGLHVEARSIARVLATRDELIVEQDIPSSRGGNKLVLNDTLEGKLHVFGARRNHLFYNHFAALRKNDRIKILPQEKPMRRRRGFFGITDPEDLALYYMVYRSVLT